MLPSTRMGQTLLVAEPDPLQRQIVDMLLAESDLDVVFVGSGREALSYLKDATPAVALLDLELPDITGAEICEKMKRITRLADVPVVLVAPATEGRGIDDATRELARFVGADLLLQKPLGDKNLRDRLHRLLSGEQAPQRPQRTSGLSTEVLEDTLEELKADAQRKALARENETLRTKLARAQEELASLRAQLDALAAEDRSDHDARVAELERRNELLREELVKCKEGKKRRGWFGRGGS